MTLLHQAAQKAVQLKPCPFCGGEARCVDLAGWEIHCDCGAQLWRARPDKDALVEHWNTRVSLQQTEQATEPAWGITHDTMNRHVSPGIPLGHELNRLRQYDATALQQQPEPVALAEMTARKDAAYEERNRVVAALAKVFPSGIARTAIEGWSEDWHGCVYIDLPTGQVSWHFHDSQAHLFTGLPPYTKTWDGHDTPEKYRRLTTLQHQEEPREPVAWECRNWRDGCGGEPVGWDEWERVRGTRCYPLESRLHDLRHYIEQGYKYELRALYADPTALPATPPGNCIHCGKELCNDLGWCNDFKAASPSTTRQQEVGSDTARLDWLEAWHDVAGKEHGYGDTGIALIVRVSDGFMVDSEFGGGIYDTLREAVDKAMLAAAPSPIPHPLPAQPNDGGEHGR